MQVIKALEETGQQLPSGYADRVDLYPHMLVHLQAFHQLDSDRKFREYSKRVKIDGKDTTQTVRHPLPISFNSLAKYASIYEYDEDMDDFDEFIFFIRKLDNAYIRFESDRTNPNGKG